MRVSESQHVIFALEVLGKLRAKIRARYFSAEGRCRNDDRSEQVEFAGHLGFPVQHRRRSIHQVFVNRLSPFSALMRV